MSQVPVFFTDQSLEEKANLILDDATSRHIVQVLRMQIGEHVALTNGKGMRADVTIADHDKRKCEVYVEKVETFEPRKPSLHLAVAFTKNKNRNEWLLEKATEIGVATIIPLQTERSERDKFRFDRMHSILQAAIIQSQQFYKPTLEDLSPLDNVIDQYKNVPQKLVAHCLDNDDKMSVMDVLEKDKETLLLIGPEGDFTEEEIMSLTSFGFKAVSLGNTRLRTETAAVTACVCFNMINDG